MTARPTDRILAVVSEVVGVGRALAVRGGRVALPIVARALGAVTSRVEPPEAPLPAPEVEIDDEVGSAAAAPAVPTPGAVARNIAPHPPPPRKKGAARPSAPGARLPVRRTPPGPGA